MHQNTKRLYSRNCWTRSRIWRWSLDSCWRLSATFSLSCSFYSERSRSETAEHDQSPRNHAFSNLVACHSAPFEPFFVMFARSLMPVLPQFDFAINHCNTSVLREYGDLRHYLDELRQIDCIRLILRIIPEYPKNQSLEYSFFYHLEKNRISWLSICCYCCVDLYRCKTVAVSKLQIELFVEFKFLPNLSF